MSVTPSLALSSAMRFSMPSRTSPCTDCAQSGEPLRASRRQDPRGLETHKDCLYATPAKTPHRSISGLFVKRACAILLAISCSGRPDGLPETPGCHFHAAIRVASRHFSFSRAGGVLARDTRASFSAFFLSSWASMLSAGFQVSPPARIVP
jgi:hypothetical protein